MNKKLIPALRQFRHNDSDEFVSGYDMAIVDREFAALEKQIVEEAAALCERFARRGMSAAECASAVRFLKVSLSPAQSYEVTK